MAHMNLARNLDEDSSIEYDILSPGQAPWHKRTVGTTLDDVDGDLSPAARDLVFECRLRNLRDRVTLPEQYRVLVARDEEVSGGRFYFQIACMRPDTFTGVMGEGRGGKAYLSPDATDSELVQTIFGLYKSYVEHEARETFLYDGRRVFGPHIDINALWEVAERYDARPNRDLNV